MLDGIEVDKFLEENGLTVDEGYEFILNRTSECRLQGYYPQYFYDKKVPLILSELRIDQRRPSKKQRFSKIAEQPREQPEGKENHFRYSSGLLREWKLTSPNLKPKKKRINQDDSSIALATIAGCLLKKTVAYGGYIRWEKRYVVLSPEALKYTKSKDVTSAEAKWRVYPFTALITDACRIGQDGITLLIDGNVFGYPRILELRATTTADAKQWCEKLNTASRNHY